MRNLLKNSWLGQALAALVLLLIGATPSLASGFGCDAPVTGRLADIQSRSQLKPFVQCAIQYVDKVGWDQALQDFKTDTRWHDGPMYLFALDTDGVVIFNVSGSTLPGQDRLHATDADGKPHIARMLFTTRTFGEGFTTYRFRNPDTEKLDLKVTYHRPTNRTYQGRTVIMAAGYYPLDAPGSCHPEYVRASLVYTLEDAERFVRCAEHYLHANGLRALHDFRLDPRWRSGPTYLFLYDREALVAVMNVANPHLEGTYRGDSVDSTGFRYVEEFAHNVRLFGDGITYYEFRNPVTEAVEPKSAYVRNVRIDGFDYFLGAGVYTPVRPECRNMPYAYQVDTKPELELYVRCAADLIETRGAEAFDLFLHHRTWIGGATYIFVNDAECLSLFNPQEYRQEEEDRCNLSDSQGTLLNQNIWRIATSDAGEGYTSYIWRNPASGKEEPKTAFVMGVELDGEIIAVGAGLYGLE